jgi:hypothetical protein
MNISRRINYEFCVAVNELRGVLVHTENDPKCDGEFITALKMIIASCDVLIEGRNVSDE